MRCRNSKAEQMILEASAAVGIDPRCDLSERLCSASLSYSQLDTWQAVEGPPAVFAIELLVQRRVVG